MYVCMYVCTLYEFFFSLCFSVESVKKKEVHMEMEAVVCVQELHIVQCMYVCMYIGRYGILHPIIDEKLKTNKGKIFYFRTGRI